MARQSIFDMKVSKVYPLLLQKVERKGRSKEELDTVIAWLTGYDMNRVDPEMTYGDFFRQAPGWTSWWTSWQRAGLWKRYCDERRETL